MGRCCSYSNEPVADPPQDKDELAEWMLSEGGKAAISLHLDKSGEIIPSGADQQTD